MKSTASNKGMQAAYSVRSCLAPASNRGSCLAFGIQTFWEDLLYRSRWERAAGGRIIDQHRCTIADGCERVDQYHLGAPL